MIEKSSAVLAGRSRNNIAGLCGKFSSTYSMHFSVSSAREDWFLLFTRTPSGNESLGSARNSGKPPPVEPGRNCLSLSLDLNFVTSSSLGIGSKMLAVAAVAVGICNQERWTVIFLLGARKSEENLQNVVSTRAVMICESNNKKIFII